MSATDLAEIAVAHRQPISVAMYHQMIDSGILGEHDRVELIEGIIVSVSPQSPAAYLRDNNAPAYPQPSIER